MAGGKGKSSGGKSSGGKVGVDGGKKQQSHSSKAGLQVSIAHRWDSFVSFMSTCEERFNVCSDAQKHRMCTPPSRVSLINNNKRDGRKDYYQEMMRSTLHHHATLSKFHFKRLRSHNNRRAAHVNKSNTHLWAQAHPYEFRYPALF